LEDLYYAANIGESQAASLLATAYMSQNVCNIPLWSYTSYVAWRKELAGVVNMKGVGTVNDWTFLNAWRVKTTNPLRFACVSSWDILNVMYSQWYFEYALLDRVYNGFIAVNPYDLAADIPWAAQDWEIGTWIDPRTGSEKQKVKYYLRPDNGAATPGPVGVGGNFSGYFDANDYEFTCWYNYAFDDDWQWSSFMDINHIKLIDGSTAEVYFDDISMWFVYAPIYPLLGPSTVLTDMLCDNATATFTGSDLEEGLPGYFEYAFTADQVVHVISATVNGNPIVEDVDFYIRAGYDTFTHNIFVPMVAFAPSDVISITYNYPIADGAGGSYVGGNLGYDWTDTMYAYGYMYPVSISGTSAALNRNPYFQMETIPKGEIDFRWNYIAGAKPRQGYFKIDILDVVKCTGSYCTRGDGAYNAVYLPGADLDDTDVCHIGILDLVTITGKYANTFGKQPLTTVGVVGGNTTIAAAESYIVAQHVGYVDQTGSGYESYKGIWIPRALANDPGEWAGGVFTQLQGRPWVVQYRIGMLTRVDGSTGTSGTAGTGAGHVLIEGTLSGGTVMGRAMIDFTMADGHIEHVYLMIW
jgi:hypothetical protein